MLEKVGNIKVKIVERTGDKIVDLVHKSNAWSNKDCMREDCLICASCTDEEERGKCYRRNVVYETFCLTCEEVNGEGSCPIETEDCEKPSELLENSVKRRREENDQTEEENVATKKKGRDFKCK